MIPITRNSRALAWRAAVDHLVHRPRWEDYNLILEITEPMSESDEDLEITAHVDKFLKTRKSHPVHTVSETIFPAAEYVRHGTDGVYKTYPEEIYPSIKELPEVRWGTYAYRLVRRPSSTSDSGYINPLEECVKKLARQVTGKSPKTACYEMSVVELDADLALYDPTTDRNHHIGGPCLSHVSFKLTRDKRLVLTALYRSHYYIQKALGNLLGLARLQAFVCEQVKVEPGPLVCMSTYATVETESKRWGKDDVWTMVGKLGVKPRRSAPSLEELR
jgi:hypothetical protein